MFSTVEGSTHGTLVSQESQPFELPEPIRKAATAVGRATSKFFKSIGDLVSDTEGLGLLLRGVTVVVISIN
jgi:hypothetical protein